MNAGAVFAEPLVDLGADNPAFAGIQTPLSALGARKRGGRELFHLAAAVNAGPVVQESDLFAGVTENSA